MVDPWWYFHAHIRPLVARLGNIVPRVFSSELGFSELIEKDYYWHTQEVLDILNNISSTLESW